jgi:curved DNA-binding protein
LGGHTTIDTLTGRVKLTVKPFTQNLSKVRLRGKGFPVYKHEGEAGDLIVTFQVDLPQTLTPHQQELLKMMQAEEP